MSFTPPKTLQDLLIYVWKIIDLPRINKDHLINAIALDFYLASPSNARELVIKAINAGLLLEDQDTEEIRLSTELEKTVSEWQNEGKNKRLQIQSILNESWRNPIPITDDLKFNVYIREIADVIVWEKALKIRTSMIETSQEDFQNIIEGSAKHFDSESEKILQYPFKIDFKNKLITHFCPEYDSLRKAQKKLCPHLAAVFNRSYAKNKAETMNTVRQMVIDWSFWKMQ
jgi:hypothetical protein